MTAIVHPFVSAKVDEEDASLIRPSDWNAEHSYTGLVTCVRPEEFGTINGIDDNDAVYAASQAAQTNGYQLRFTSGVTYCFSGDNSELDLPCHVVIEFGATCKVRPDDGSATFSGLFAVYSPNVIIENYGTIDGNASQQTDNYSAATYSGLITSFSTDISPFVYDDHGIGLITNAAYSAFVFFETGTIRIRSANIDGVCQQHNFNGSAAVWLQGCAKAKIEHLSVVNSPCYGFRLIGASTAPDAGTEDEGGHFNDILVDHRGLTMPNGGGGGCLEVNNTYVTGLTPIMAGVTISNVTYWAADAVVGTPYFTAGLSIGHTFGSPMTISNVNILGSSVLTACGYGIEIGNPAILSNIYVEKTDVGILTGSTDEVYTYGIKVSGAVIRQTLAMAVQVTNAGAPVDLDLMIEDCGLGTSHDGILIQDGTFVSNATIKLNARYFNANTDRVVVWGSGAGRVVMHDCLIENLMASNHEVKIRLDGNGAAVLDSTMIGKGDTGTAVLLAGTGTRIANCHFKDYSKPWDTGGGTNSLISNNLVESCTTPAGTTAGSDTLANNKSF